MSRPQLLDQHEQLTTAELTERVPPFGGDMDFETTITSKDSGKPYTIRCTSGKWSCTCPQWLYRLRKSGASCKHIDQVRKHLAEQEVLQKKLMDAFDTLFGFDDIKLRDDDES